MKVSVMNAVCYKQVCYEQNYFERTPIGRPTPCLIT